MPVLSVLLGQGIRTLHTVTSPVRLYMCKSHTSILHQLPELLLLPLTQQLIALPQLHGLLQPHWQLPELQQED